MYSVTKKEEKTSAVTNLPAFGDMKGCKLYQELATVMDCDKANDLVLGLILERYDNKLSYLNLIEGVLRAFIWGQTSQGVMFWADLYVAIDAGIRARQV